MAGPDAGSGGLQSERGPVVVQRRVRWRPCVRIVPSRFPPEHLFARVADRGDWDAVIAVESLTNDRLRDATGTARMVPEVDRVEGAGASYIMASFTHVSPAGGRFTDGTYGAYYAARTRETAIRETVHHRERFMAATSERAMDLEMRVVEADLDGMLHDMRGRKRELGTIHDPDDYSASRALARTLRATGSNGVAYDSVRHDGGQCVAIFRPRLLRRGRQSEHLLYRWNGERIAEVLRLTHRF